MTERTGSLLCLTVFAHVGQPVEPHDLWSSWGSDPVVYAGLLVVEGLYLRGLRRMWRRGGVGAGISVGRSVLFLAGLVVALLALESPIDALGTALFSGHMLQHELLAAVAAPLIVLGEPLRVIPRGVPPRWRRRIGRAERLLGGVGAKDATSRWMVSWFIAFVASFWLWHIPALYEAALRSDVVHSVQHTFFLLPALGLWWCALGPHRRRFAPLGAVLLAATAIQGTIGGVNFVFAERAYYEPYRTTTEPWGLDPVEDIALGGAIMWTAGPIFIAAAVVLFGRWLARQEQPLGA